MPPLGALVFFPQEAIDVCGFMYPFLIPTAIEEILRVDGPLVANRRTTTKEVEIQGRTIPKGENLTLIWIAANRDLRIFNDPEVINLERRTDADLVWGQGIHICLDASLA